MSNSDVILVTGGAGYIGSHCVDLLRAKGKQVIVLDNLTTGHKRLLGDCPLIEADTRDTEALKKVFQSHNIKAVMHFAASAYVGESVTDPYKYYENNVYGTLQLLYAMKEARVNQFIFSSTCATYGNPQYTPLDEQHPFAPINPYGFTKRVVEQMLLDFQAAYGLRFVSLRYFNAAGADPDCARGEAHEPETHLIPLVLQVASGRRDHISVFGTDYDTPDGTCIRDYIHILDIAQAHYLSFDYLEQGGVSNIFNIGTETGHSVKEVIATCERVTGKNIKVVEGPRREGDPPILVASAKKIRETLGWKPKYPNLEETIQTAWAWEQKEALQAQNTTVKAAH